MAEIFSESLNNENSYTIGDNGVGRLMEKTVNVPNLLNVREKPSLEAKIVRTVKKGSVLTVIKNMGEWSQIDENEFVMSQYLV